MTIHEDFSNFITVVLIEQCLNTCPINMYRTYRKEFWFDKIPINQYELKSHIRKYIVEKRNSFHSNT